MMIAVARIQDKDAPLCVPCVVSLSSHYSYHPVKEIVRKRECVNTMTKKQDDKLDSSFKKEIMSAKVHECWLSLIFNYL